MPKDCHDTALRFLEHRERSAYEVRTHLVTKGFQEKEIEEELQSLEALHYVDDDRYCNSYIRYARGKGRGPIRLQFELREKGIDAVRIQEALRESFDCRTEKEAAMKEARKVLDRCAGAADEKIIAKIGRKLASLGYHTDVIYEIIGQIRRNPESRFNS